jgi:Cyclopropane fatty acid synthase and related methyltransferases
MVNGKYYNKLEPMADFFAARVGTYDGHMLSEVEGCAEGYKRMAKLVPNGCRTLLDLGCGTGLELEEIFKLQPDIDVIGIDLSQAMLDKLTQKFIDKKLTLRCSDYLKYQPEEAIFDCAVSFQTLHHLTRTKKTELYRKIYRALVTGGIYIECDYMAQSKEDEDFFFAELARLRTEQNIPEGEFYHFDTPCTVENQLAMLGEAGFKCVSELWKKGNTTLITAKKDL